jgi:hypothetical protein
VVQITNNPWFSDATTEAAVNAVTALLNSGNISVYSGSQPTDANTAITSQVLLASCTFGSTAFAASVATGSAGSKVVTATANTIATDSSAAATGTASWFRAYKSDGVTGVLDGSVGTSGCDLNLNTTSIVSGATVAVTSFTVSQAE